MRLPVPAAIDVLIAGIFVVLVVIEAFATTSVRSPLLHLTVAGFGMACLAWRRHYPILVAIVVLVANLLVNQEDQFSTALALVLVAYTNGAENDRRTGLLALAILVATFLGAIAVEGLEPSDIAAALIFLVGPWVVGATMRQRAQQTADAEARARQLEHEREAHDEAAADAERTRIARELHDIVSHSLSVIAIQTQAVRRRLEPAQVREIDDLVAVESVTREALAEMRRLFGILRNQEEGARLDPQPGLGELDRLCDQIRASGLEVELRREGAGRTLPGSLDLAAYRIVQEALTNTLKHAPGAQAEVMVRYTPDEVEVSVFDNGPGRTAGAPGQRPGHGLLGMRERVAIYGGRLRVGDRPGGGDARPPTRVYVSTKMTGSGRRRPGSRPLLGHPGQPGALGHRHPQPGAELRRDAPAGRHLQLHERGARGLPAHHGQHRPARQRPRGRLGNGAADLVAASGHGPPPRPGRQ
jgi:signal transduction histidine kinase